MKHIKIFETLRRKPKIGDYVRCQEKTYFTDDDIFLFIKSNIGLIVNINQKPDFNHPYFIKYVNIPANIKHRFTDDGVRKFSLEEIKRYANNEEIKDYEIKQKINKYNL
jgi:hypothetical protein